MVVGEVVEKTQTDLLGEQSQFLDAHGQTEGVSLDIFFEDFVKNVFEHFKVMDCCKHKDDMGIFVF